MREVRKRSDHTIATNEKISKVSPFSKIFIRKLYRLKIGNFIATKITRYMVYVGIMHVLDAFPKLCQHNCRRVIQR